MTTLAEIRATATPSTTTRKPAAYSITQVRRVMDELTAWIESTGDALDTAESADYPNDERIDKLQTRLDALEAALEALGDIE